jgi:hypothetical protein
MALKGSIKFAKAIYLEVNVKELLKCQIMDGVMLYIF